MKSLNFSKIYWVFAVFALIYSVQVLPRLNSDSLTNDEPAEITNGYYYLTQGDVITPHLHPPLASALAALPLLALHLKTMTVSGDVIDRAHSFIFDWNLDQISAITISSRAVVWFFGLLIGFLLCQVTQTTPAICAGALFFWAFNPTLLALAGIAKIEIIPVFFFFAAVLAFQKGFEKSSSGWSFFSGMVAAMAVTAKLYGLTLIPIFVLLEAIQSKENHQWRKIFKKWCWSLAGFLTFVILLYAPAFLFYSHPLGAVTSLGEKFLEDFVFARHPFPVYFWGRSGLENHWYYFPAAFLLKEPLAFIFALVLSLGLFSAKKIKLPLWQWLTAVIFFIAVLPATNLGVRYLLPAYPFLFLVAAHGLDWLRQEGQKKVLFLWVLGGLVLWQTVSVGLCFPHELSYFNELVPSDQKLGYLADSNLDWGQDLKRLANTAQENHWGTVKLAYMGGTDPKVYGLNWEPFQSEDLIKPQPGKVYAVNASFYQLAPVAYPSTLPIARSWLSKMEPTGKVGDGWFYFEIPGVDHKGSAGGWLPSAPFLQYRGYAYSLNLRE